MRKKLSLAFLLLLVAGSLLQAAPRLRVVIMTDFPPVDVVPGGMGFGAPERRSDSDDVQSMVRFLLYTNEFDVEGLIATSATFANVADKQNLLRSRAAQPAAARQPLPYGRRPAPGDVAGTLGHVG